MIRNSAIAFVVSAVASGLLAATTAAHAATYTHNYPAFMCTPDTANYASNVYKLENNGYVQNGSTTANTGMFCPLPTNDTAVSG